MVLLVTQVQRAAAYEYVGTLYEDEYDDASPEVHTSTKWEDATASATPDKNDSTCSCGVHTYAWAKVEDSAIAFAMAWAMVSEEWVWNGPPGTAPGGTLDWNHDGQGLVSLWGYRDSTQGSTRCASNADSLTGATCSTGPLLSRFIGSAEGSVSDWNLATAGTSHDVTDATLPEAWHFADQYPAPPGGYGYGWFDLLLNWGIYDYGSANIAPGTAQFIFDFPAFCDSYSEAEADGDAATWSSTYASALVRAHGTFR